MQVLISGAGIAGPTVAYWLCRAGFTPTLVERAPAPRTSGYIIDFWGSGFDVAARMGIAPNIRQAGYAVQELRTVDRDGRILAALPVESFTRALGSALTSVPRGDLARAVFDTVDGRVETIFGDEIAALREGPSGVEVVFGRHPARTFDLVIGADGLHSRVRELACGPQERFERYLGIKVAACTVAGYRPRDESVYVMYPQIGRQAARFSLRDDRTMFLFTFADADPHVPPDDYAQRALLRREFAGTGWECDEILDAVDGAGELYMDRVSQIDMPAAGAAWSRGRLCLVGDAAFCISLLGGQGAALAMTAAYILAAELNRAEGDYGGAFARYERRLTAVLAGKQRAARRFSGMFAPRSRWSLLLRIYALRLLSHGFLARIVTAGGFRDRIALPELSSSDHSSANH